MGKRDPMWDPIIVSEKETVKPNFVNSILARMLSVIQSLLFINRIIDSLGLGESFVVQLHAEGKSS